MPESEMSEAMASVVLRILNLRQSRCIPGNLRVPRALIAHCFVVNLENAVLAIRPSESQSRSIDFNEGQGSNLVKEVV